MEKYCTMQKSDMYLFLSAIYRIQQYEINILQADYGSLEALMYIEEKEILKNKNLRPKLLKNIVKYRGHLQIKDIKRVLQNKNIKYVCFEDDNYPEGLKNIDMPPPILFYIGDFSILNYKGNIAVVGSRTPTNYGLHCVRKYAKQFSDIGANIVSGLALGIDCEAHMACMKGKSGKTIAVLGSPLDNIRPATNLKIAKEILKNGGVIVSEFFIGSKVLPVNFKNRNRIISGLSSCVLVVEAAQKSGAIGTAEYASDQGRPVFAIPGRLNDPKSKGCIDLLYDGATIFREFTDIFKDERVFLDFDEFCTLNNRKDSIEYDIKSLNYEKKEILKLINQQGSVKIDDICEYTGIDIKKINSNLNELLIDEYIIEMEDETYGFNV